MTIASPEVTARWSQRSENQQPLGAARFSELMTAALNEPGLRHIGTRSLQRHVRRFMELKIHERNLVTWVIAYADPTGETAVRNVMRTRR